MMNSFFEVFFNQLLHEDFLAPSIILSRLKLPKKRKRRKIVAHGGFEAQATPGVCSTTALHLCYNQLADLKTLRNTLTCSGEVREQGKPKIILGRNHLV